MKYIDATGREVELTKVEFGILKSMSKSWTEHSIHELPGGLDDYKALQEKGVIDNLNRLVSSKKYIADPRVIIAILIYVNKLDDISETVDMFMEREISQNSDDWVATIPIFAERFGIAMGINFDESEITEKREDRVISEFKEILVNSCGAIVE
ncbi:hypothetical protein HYV12_00510 [Candidatus Dojkabacteria bacterium]|nr:hypothetical protein [Candidatus Dojkabacteria bacterium]